MHIETQCLSLSLLWSSAITKKHETRPFILYFMNICWHMLSSFHWPRPLLQRVFLNAYWNSATNTVSLELHSFHLFRATALHFMRQCCGINICGHVFAYIYVFIKLCVCLCCHVYLSVWLDWRLQGTVLRTQVPVPGSTFSTMTNGCSSSVATVRWRSSDTCSRKLPYRGQIG